MQENSNNSAGAHFDLELSYICPNVIAMCCPSDEIECAKHPHRNNIKEVKRFLDQKHSDHYHIYNLCLEKLNPSYDHVFSGSVSHYGFEDQTPPRFEMIDTFCLDVQSWLDKDERNVAVVHCKAGRGRTCTMISCFLLYSGMVSTAEEAFSCFVAKRGIVPDVIVPSQRRWIGYFEQYHRHGRQYHPNPIILRTFRLDLLTKSFQRGFVLVVRKFSRAGELLHLTPSVKESRDGDGMNLMLEKRLRLTRDVRFDIMVNEEGTLATLFHFWINTAFLHIGTDDSLKDPELDPTSRSGPSHDQKYSLSQPHDPKKRIFLPESRACESASDVFQITLKKEEMEQCFRDVDNEEFPPDFSVTLFYSLPSRKRKRPISDARHKKSLPVSFQVGSPKSLASNIA